MHFLMIFVTKFVYTLDNRLVVSYLQLIIQLPSQVICQRDTTKTIARCSLIPFVNNMQIIITFEQSCTFSFEGGLEVRLKKQNIINYKPNLTVYVDLNCPEPSTLIKTKKAPLLNMFVVLIEIYFFITRKKLYKKSKIFDKYL